VLVDGVQVHQDDGWHEARCGACYGDGSGGPSPIRYAVRFEKAAEFVPFVCPGAPGCRCGLEKAKRVVLLGDGAEWIWKQVGGLLKEAVCPGAPG